MHGIFWMVIGHSGTCYRGTQPHGIERHFLDGNRPLWYMLPWYSAPTVMHGIFWMVIGLSGTFYCGIQPTRKCMVYFIFYIFLCYSRVRVVLRCQYVHRTRKSPDLELKYEILYSGEHNKRQCPDHRQTFAANKQRSQARATPPDASCFITRPKPLKNLVFIPCLPFDKKRGSHRRQARNIA